MVDGAAKRRRWDALGLALGFALGLLDYGLFLAMGRPETRLPDPFVVAMALGVLFAMLGFAVGRLAMARGRAHRDAETIARQLRELERAQESLLQQEKLAAVGRLAAGVAHEVRNPLGVIRASASMVQESFSPGEDPYRACEFICEEIDRLGALITALLTFSRPRQPNLAEVSVDKVIDRALHLAGERLRAPCLEVEREADAPVPNVPADADLLAQVLLDLVTNAAEAIDPEAGRPGRLVIRTRSDTESLQVDVADDGPGVDPERAAQIFEPFETSKARGTGLGLAMARRIVETHRGRLELIPGAGAGPGGRGACFRVSIPRNPALGASADVEST